MSTKLLEVEERIKSTVVDHAVTYHALVCAVADGTCQQSADEILAIADKYGHTGEQFVQHVKRASSRLRAAYDIQTAGELSAETRRLKQDLRALENAPLDDNQKPEERGRLMQQKRDQVSANLLKSNRLQQNGFHVLRNTAAETGDPTDWKNFRMTLPDVPAELAGLPTY